MNNLSWIIFWADVAPQLASALCFMAFLMLGISGIIVLLGITDMFGEARYDGGEPINTDAKTAIRFRKLWAFPLLFLTLWIASFVVPDDKETYYAIAASEVGEEILKTPEVGKARQALNNWLDKQINTEDTNKENTNESN